MWPEFNISTSLSTVCRCDTMESYVLVNRVASSKSSRVQYLSLKTRSKSIDAVLISRGVDVVRLEQKDWNPYVFYHWINTLKRNFRKLTPVKTL